MPPTDFCLRKDVRRNAAIPGVLREIIKLRYRGCGHESLSAYLPKLIRYDLLLG